MKKQQGMIAAGVVCALGAAGCELVINLRSYAVVDDLTATAGTEASGAAGGAGGAGAAGGDGGSGGTGGAGGAGGNPLVCTAGETEPCYGGPEGTEGIGLCKGGTRSCNAAGTEWGACDGEVVPVAEVCLNQDDEDCNGKACAETLWVSALQSSADATIAKPVLLADQTFFAGGSFIGGLDVPGQPLVASGNPDMFLARFQANGEPIWAKGYGPNAYLTEFDATADGKILVRGATFGAATVDFGAGALPQGPFVASFDSDGTMQWTKSFGASENVAFDCSGFAASGNSAVILGGCFAGTLELGGEPLQSSGGGLFVAALDPSSGNVMWTKQYAAGKLKAIAVDSNGAIFMTGSFSGTMTTGGTPLTTPSTSAAFVVKLNSSGDTVAAASFEATDKSAGLAIAVDKLGDAYVAGTFTGELPLGEQTLTQGAGQMSTFVTHLGFTLAPKSSTKLEGSLAPGVNALSPDGNGRLFVGGFFQGESLSIGNAALPAVSMTSTTGFLSLLDSQGAHLGSRTFGGGFGTVSTWGLATDGSSNDVLATGIALTNSDLGLGPIQAFDTPSLFVLRLSP